MIPSLEELRRRLLQPAGQASPLGRLSNPDAAAGGSAAGEYGSVPGSTSSSQVPSNAGGQVTRKPSQDENPLAHVAAKAFIPVAEYRDRVAQIERSIDELSQSTGELFGSLQSLRDQMQALLKSRPPTGTFQKEPGTLESFEPMNDLQGQMVQISEAFGTYLAELARFLEQAKVLDAPLAGLAETFRSVGRLQAEFYQMSEAFRAALHTDNAADTHGKSQKRKRHRHGSLRLIEGQPRDADRRPEKD